MLWDGIYSNDIQLKTEQMSDHWVEFKTNDIENNMHTWQSVSKMKLKPTWGCQSMVEGPTIMLGVFITLLYM